MAASALKLLSLSGDGIGPEIVQATKTVLTALTQSCALQIAWEDMEI